MHESDEAAVAEAKNGDREACRTLVERHSRYLFRIVYRLTRNTEDAQDVVQDTWLKAHAQLGRFEARANVRTWLTRIAINCAIDHLRITRRREPSYDPATFEQESTRGWIETEAEPDRLVLAGEIRACYDEGTAADRTRVQSHLEQCEECRALDHELRAVLTTVDTAPITEPPTGFEREMWARIEPLLPVQSSWRTRWNGMMPRLAVAASIGVLVTAAFTAGRVWERPPAGSSGEIVEDRALNERLLRAEVEDHLERSQRVLVELVNTDYTVGSPIAGDRARAADLVAAGRLYRRSAEEIGDAEIGRLLEDLERVLVEVANGPADAASRDLARLRQRIDDQDLVFRVRVVAREMRERAW